MVAPVNIATSPRMRFSAAMDELELAYNLKIATLRREVYWKYLKKVPIDHLVDAVPLIVEHYTSFPKIPQWRKMAERVRVRNEAPYQTADGVPLKALPSPEGGGVFCALCNDTGWQRCQQWIEQDQRMYDAVKPCCRDGSNPRVKAAMKLGGKAKRPHFQDEGQAETREARAESEPTIFD
jgi:hypothetical protein